MNLRIFASASAIVIAVASAAPAHSQERNVADELVEMRAQMARMAERIATLEADLAQADVARNAVAAAVPIVPQVQSAGTATPELARGDGWTFKPRGRINIDAGFVNAPNSTGRDDEFGSEVRRIRLGASGDIPGGFGYKVEVDFAGDEVALTDAILTYEDGPLTVNVGQHNNFQSLEELSSSLHTSFIERAAFTDAFGFQRRVGVSAEYASGAALAQGGLFSGNSADLPNETWGADARFVFMPQFGTAQLHLGSSVHYRSLEDESTVRYRQRPLVHFTGERFIDTRTLDADSEFGLGLEAAAISGPFHVAAETYWQSVDRISALDDPTFFGGSFEAGYFLTAGDTRGYKGGKFDRVKPANPVGDGGTGAWQVNARYDYLDLTDAGIVGGTQDSYQISLIWTPTANTRLLLNYARLDYTDAVFPTADGDTSYGVDAVGVRAQVDF